MYACTAKGDHGARCRKWAKNQNLCPQHQKMQEKGKPVELVSLPDCIILIFNINAKWAEKIIAQGIKVCYRDFNKQDWVPSGVQVFGTQREGLVNVFLGNLFEDLNRSYKITDIHLRNRRDGVKYMYGLAMTFAKDGKVFETTQNVLDIIVKFLSVGSWGHVHVWTNPPQEDGKDNCVLNISHRQTDVQPKQTLLLADGLWKVEPIQ